MEGTQVELAAVGLAPGTQKCKETNAMIDSGKEDQRTKACTLVNTSAEAWFGGDNVRQEKDDNEAVPTGFLKCRVFSLR